ncbi:MAG: B-box zinc finger protein [Anaerolineales bacterium]|jgi:hypothetical protein
MNDAPMVCANHPNRETTLRCNRCEKPICTKCAILTPVGYRCPECVRGQQKIFDTARSTDGLIAAVISAIAVGVAGFILSYLGFWSLIVAPIVGGGIAEVIRRAVGRRRSRSLPWMAVIGGSLGLVVVLLNDVGPYLPAIMASGQGLQFAGSILLDAVWILASGGLMLSTIYARIRGIRL